MFVHINTPINKEDNIQSSSTPLVAVYRVKRRKTEAKVTVKWALLDTCNSNERLDMRKRNMPDIDMKLEDEVVLSPGSSTQLQPPSEKRQKGQTRVTGRGAERNSFAKRIEDLRAYKEEHGNVNVKREGLSSLYQFCAKMRRVRNNPEKSTKTLTDDRIASLDALGFDWGTSSDKSFAQRIEDLRLYKEKNKHVDVKWNDEDSSLYTFCKHIRYARNNPESSKALTDDRIASLDALGFVWSNSSIKSFARQTDRLPSKKRKQKGQGKVDTTTKKNRGSAKNDKVCASSSSDQIMEAPVTVKDAAALSYPLPTLGHSDNDVSDVSPFAVSTTTALASDNMDAIDLTTDVETESVKKYPTSLASVLLEEKGKRLVQVKQEMVETREDLKDVREDLDIANDTVTQQAVFTNAWQNKFEEIAKLAEVGRVDGAKISEIRNRSISTGQDKARDWKRSQGKEGG